MMNWNSNDTKYIIKRIILYFIIAGIVFFAGQSCAKANVYTEHWNTAGNWVTIPANSNAYGISISGNRFANLGHGNLVFSLTYWGETPYYNINELIITTKDNNNTAYDYTCDIGNASTYYDSQTMQTTITANCRVWIPENGIYQLIVYRPTTGVGKLYVQLGPFISFTTIDSEASAIINANNAAIQQQINAGNTNAQAIQNAITNATQNEITAINNQTEWFEEQHDPLIDTGFLDVMGDLITTNDSDVVRQFIMIPFNLFVQIYNACTSNTCSALTLGTLYGTTLTLPCINWTTLVGSAIANTIDIIFSACLIFGMYRMIKHMINKIFTLSSTITDECGVEVFN